jgi:hypothetical protein
VLLAQQALGHEHPLQLVRRQPATSHKQHRNTCNMWRGNTRPGNGTGKGSQRASTYGAGGCPLQAFLLHTHAKTENPQVRCRHEAITSTQARKTPHAALTKRSCTRSASRSGTPAWRSTAASLSPAMTRHPARPLATAS